MHRQPRGGQPHTNMAATGARAHRRDLGRHPLLPRDPLLVLLALGGLDGALELLLVLERRPPELHGQRGPER